MLLGTVYERGGSRRSRAGELEVEEEFDLIKLGFVIEPEAKAPSTSGQSSITASDAFAPQIASVLIEDDHRSKRPQLASFRPRSTTGRYLTADWSPPLVQPKLSSEGESISEETSAPIETEIIAHDFARLEPAKPPTQFDKGADAKVNPLVDSGSVTSTPSLASGIVTSTETTTATPILAPRQPRSFSARLVTIRRPGRKGARTGIRILRKPVQQDIDISDLESQDDPLPPPPAPLPKSQFVDDVVETYNRDLYDKIKLASKLHNTNGHLLPQLIRDLLPALSDRKQAVQLVNEVRANFDLPLLSSRVDRILLQRSLAQMRETLYIELASAFILPHAPPELPPVSPDAEAEDKMSMSMTPSSFETLSRTLPNAFPADRSSIKAVFESKAKMYGEEGDVVWVGGVGSMKRRLKDGESGLGYRGGDREGLVHVFVDHSNILYGLTHHLYSSPLPLPPRHQRILSLPCLSLLLRRGRPTRSSHLVASSPLHQDFDPLVRLNWEVSILKRVEVYESEVTDASATQLTPKPAPRSVAMGGGGGTRRFKEQGVDEILTLKMLQTINRVEVVKGSTLVLATGDAKGGQFNQEGFLGAVREAVRRGWNVELWSFSSGLSRAWRDTARREKWDGRFKVFIMDEWAAELVEVNEEAE